MKDPGSAKVYVPGKADTPGKYKLLKRARANNIITKNLYSLSLYRHYNIQI